MARTIALDSKTLEGGIEALTSAARAFQLTPFERGAHRALIVSVDVAVGSLVAFVALIAITTIIAAPPGAAATAQPIHLTPVQEAFVLAPLVASMVAFAFASVVGIVSLALNIPLLRKLYRERARLKKLGLSSLSESLWKESRRGRWISRARGVLLIVVGIFMFFGFFGGAVASLVGLMTPRQMTEFEGEIQGEWQVWLWGALFYATMAVLIFSARYLQNQRERMELTASAEELKKLSKACDSMLATPKLCQFLPNSWSRPPKSNPRRSRRNERKLFCRASPFVQPDTRSHLIPTPQRIGQHWASRIGSSLRTLWRSSAQRARNSNRRREQLHVPRVPRSEI